MPNFTNISVHNYMTNVPKRDSWVQTLRGIIPRKLPNCTSEEVDIYNTGGEAQRFIESGSESRLVLFVNSTYNNEQGNEPHTTVNTIFGIELGVDLPVLKVSQKGVPIMDGDLPIAEYIAETNELNILFNIFATHNEKFTSVFEKILEYFDASVWYPKTLFHSWKLTPDKKGLTAELIEKIKKSKEDQLILDKKELQELETAVDKRQRDLKTAYDRMYSKRVSIDAIEIALQDVPKRVVDEMDMIANHAKIEDLKIKDGKYIVTTVPLYCHTEKGKRFYLGRCRIEMKPEISEVRFFNDENPRQGYWTSHDPHPHVNGGNGIACLGNAAPGIAELSSQNQIYALTLLCIEFLESANTGDPAGRRVTNWDEVDDTGKIIYYASGEDQDDDDDFGFGEDEEEELFDVYEHVTMNVDEQEHIYYEPEGHHEVTEAERDENYHFHEEAAVWVRGE